MENQHKHIQSTVYDCCNFVLSEFESEAESREYNACRFRLNGRLVLSRSAKVTPKKVGQFVTFWKRNEHGIIEPFHENDAIDYFVITVQSSDDQLGQFVFPKDVLIKNGILSKEKKEGKRGFRVYPQWDIAQSKQAQKTQKWQLGYFYEINDSMDMERIKQLFLLN